MADKNMEAQISVEFEEAAARQSLNSGDSINTLFGKIKKFFSDLKPVAFSGDAATVNGYTINANVPALGYYYATCDSALTTNIKTVTCEGFEFKEGARITVRFTANNGDSPPSSSVFVLKINEDAGRRIAYNDWYGEGILTEIDSKKSEAFCSNQVWDFIFINGRFIMQAPLIGYQMDDILSNSSRNPVQNKVIKQAIDNKADKTVATTSANGLMSAEDKVKLDAFEITTTGGKLHDKDIATIDDIPTSLPANGGNADTAKQVECVDIIGTADSCTYKTILDWANHYTNLGCSAWAFVQSGYGVPSDAPEQIEGVVRIESDDTGARRLVTWSSYHANGCNIFTRPIFNNIWNGDWHTVNADTLDGYHAADFANAYNDYLGTYLAGKSGDIRELAYLLPTGGLLANTLYPEFENITFPTFGDILITWNKSKHSQNGYIYGVLTIRPMTSTGDTYICSIYNNTSYTDWQKIADGGNADKLDGLHSTDFVNANIGQIQIPSNVDVPAWIYANGKRYQIYMTNDGNIGLTNVPNDSRDRVWYWFDGINIFAREWTTGKYYICDMINGGFSGWKDVYTSGYKPYVTGVVVTDSNGKANVPFGFDPSFVLYVPTSPKSGIFGSVYSATTFDVTGFTPSADTYTGGLTGNGFSYIAFK